MKNKSLKEWIIYIFKLTKIFIIELFEPKVSFYAASMSWSTLFFIIPLIVIILSIIIYTPIFNEYYAKIHNLIEDALVPTSSKQIMTWIDTFVANASQMGYIGTFYVIIAAILFFKDFDYIVNDIFDDSRRSFFEALLVYGILLISIPTAIASSIWIFSKINNTLHFGPAIIQFLIIWAIIFTIYKVAPKEKIPFNILAISSLVTTIVWYVAKSIFVFYILYNKTYSTIYGTISVVLFTFLWIYISWMIFLHGLQLCSMLLKEDEEEAKE